LGYLGTGVHWFVLEAASTHGVELFDAYFADFCVAGGFGHDLLHTQASAEDPSLVRGPHCVNTTAATVNQTTVQPKSDIS
jgi:hypothetical protein